MNWELKHLPEFLVKIFPPGSVGFGQSFFELFYIIEFLTRACNASRRLLRSVVDAAAADIVCFGCCTNAIG